MSIETEPPAAAGMRAVMGRTFSSFQHRNYRLFFAGQIISLIGTWMQNAAQQWLVYELTGSEALLGTVAAVGVAPLFFLSTVGGVVAERLPKRRVLTATQCAAMVLAFVLAALVLTGTVQVWHILVLSALLGTVMAFDIPTRQAFVVEMVGTESLTSGIALNSATFNSARIIGPAVAGLLMAGAKGVVSSVADAGAVRAAAMYGMGICFLVNGASFIAVIVALQMMRLEVRPRAPRERLLRLVSGGFVAVWRLKQVLAVMVLLGVAVIFGFSYAVLLPVFAKHLIEPGGLSREALYGFLLSSTGVGAVIGALVVATLTGEKRRLFVALLSGVLLACGAIVVFSFSHHAALSMMLLLVVGLGLATFTSASNTLIQVSVTDAVRGRVMAVWALMIGGMSPIGGLEAGWLASWLGAPTTLRIGAAVVGMAALTVAFTGARFIGAPRRECSQQAPEQRIAARRG